MNAVAINPLPKLRTVRLYGKLGARFGRVHRLAVSNAAEAVRALCSQLQGFDQHLMESKDKGVAYAVFVGKRNLSEQELDIPPGRDDIRIAPIIIGAKSGGWFMVIVGAVLLGVAVFMTGGLAAAFAAGAGTWGTVATMGAALMVGGAALLLAPTPKGGAEDRPEDRPSYVFNGPVNTQAQGNPVPLLYGRLYIGSAVISASIIVSDDVTVTEDPVGGTGGGGSAGSGGGGAGGGSAPWHLDWVIEA